ncbi:MAG: isoprenylcysteine carboxylmethyltransferase family protein [Acidobacteria bacterium]|nr:isoprenylcysteine carboxylmethyltransferase family protein [Acidobacteriota bacterium]
MINEAPFRFSLLALLALLLPAAAFFRFRSHTGEKLDRRQEGLPVLISLRLSGLAMWILLFLWLVDPQKLSWAGLSLPPWMRWTGVVLAVLAFSWLVWMLRTLGASLTDTVVTRQKAYLVTGGPYRYVRHPMYAAVLPLGVSFSLLTSSWLFAPLTALAFILLFIRTRKEEENLLARFPEDYRRYMDSTGRFFPRLRHR